MNFRRFRKAILKRYYCPRHVRSSVRPFRMERRDSRCKDFPKISCLVVLIKLIEMFSFCSQLKKKLTRTLHNDSCKFISRGCRSYT